jgi:hypothetical protein
MFLVSVPCVGSLCSVPCVSSLLSLLPPCSHGLKAIAEAIAHRVCSKSREPCSCNEGKAFGVQHSAHSSWTAVNWREEHEAKVAAMLAARSSSVSLRSFPRNPHMVAPWLRAALPAHTQWCKAAAPCGYVHSPESNCSR